MTANENENRELVQGLINLLNELNRQKEKSPYFYDGLVIAQYNKNLNEIIETITTRLNQADNLAEVVKEFLKDNNSRESVLGVALREYERSK